jgi:hypothetical protein
MKPLGPPPPPPPRPTSWGVTEDAKPRRREGQKLKAGQIQFLKKIRDTPLTREVLDYYSGHKYYHELVGRRLESFIHILEQGGYIERKGSSPEIWTCTTKGIDATKKLIVEARSNPSCLQAGLKDLSADELLKIATELKRDGNLDGAIEVLIMSYEKIGRSSTTYQSATFLRLPNYLVLAGRFDEAWGYLNKLITKAGNMRDKSNIYSAMASALHKESKHAQAIALKALSLIAWAHFWYIQSEDTNFSQEAETRDEFREAFTKFSQDKYIASKLKQSIPKKARTIALDMVVDYICKALERPAEIKYDIAYVDIDRIIHEQIRDRNAPDKGE